MSLPAVSVAWVMFESNWRCGFSYLSFKLQRKATVHLQLLISYFMPLSLYHTREPLHDPEFKIFLIYLNLLKQEVGGKSVITARAVPDGGIPTHIIQSQD